MTIPVEQVQVGDKIKRGQFFHPVLKIERRPHQIIQGEVIAITHDRGTLAFCDGATVEIERAQP